MDATEALFELIKKGVSPVQVVRTCEGWLDAAGFRRIEYGDRWELVPGGRYYVNHHDTSLFAFSIGRDWEGEDVPPVRIAAAHTDFPCLRVKPAPDLSVEGYAQVNVEVYGGAILSTWLDRPLGVAGRVAVRGDGVFSPCILDFSPERSLFTIPNLAIHMNRDVNKGVVLDRQTDMLPIAALLPRGVGEAGSAGACGPRPQEWASHRNQGVEAGTAGACGPRPQGDAFLSFLAGELGVEKGDILSYELTVYCREEPGFVGLGQEFLQGPRLDNLTSCAALAAAAADAACGKGLGMAAFFDHEEIGSRGKQGAGSILLHDMLLRILRCLGRGEEADRDIYRGMLLSMDVAHGFHPNYAGKMDITNKPMLGRGICIKEASSQAYATDCGAIASIRQLCEANGIPCQSFVKRSDMAGGGTLGTIAQAMLPVRAVDVGVPILAMHSARELMGRADQQALKSLAEAFLSAQ